MRYSPGASRTTPPSWRSRPCGRARAARARSSRRGTRSPRPPCRSRRRRGRCPAAASRARASARAGRSASSPARPRRPRRRSFEQAVALQVGERADVAQRAGEVRRAVAHRRQPAHELGAARHQGVEVEVAAVRRADELRRGHAAGAHDVVDLVVALVEAAGLLQPPHDVAPAVGAGHAHVLAHGDVTSRPERSSSSAICTPVAEAPTTSTRPGRSASGAVVERRDLVDRGGQVGGEGRHAGAVEGARRQDDGGRPPGPSVGRHHVARRRPRHEVTSRPRAHRRGDVRRRSDRGTRSPPAPS